VSHYELRLEKDVRKLRKRLGKLGKGVQTALENSIQSVLTLDQELASETILGDLPINRRFHKLDHRCHVFIARHLPSAHHLRFVSGVLRVITMLERVGDYAETMSRASLQLTAPPPPRIVQDMEMLFRHVSKNLGQALRAFLEEDEALARGTLASAKQYLPTFDQVYEDLVKEGEEKTRPVVELFSLLAIFNRLERVLHHSKNICEQTIFVVAGETKVRKRFDILFVDGQNAGASQLAEHYARKAYPGGGTFASAAWGATQAPAEPFLAFAAAKGLDLAEAECTPFAEIEEQLPDYDILIDMTGQAREQITRIPFHTTLLTWKLEQLDDPEQVYEQLVPRLHELFVCIRGEEDED
jgi:phosphate transport system protein